MDRNAAIEFIVSKIVEQAGREQVPLSPMERAVLRGTSTFENDLARARCEAKMTLLMQHAWSRDPSARWRHSLRALRGDNAYVLQIVEESGIARRTTLTRDYVIYIAAALLVLAGAMWIALR